MAEFAWTLMRCKDEESRMESGFPELRGAPARPPSPLIPESPVHIALIAHSAGKIETQGADILKHCLSNLYCPLLPLISHLRNL